MLQFGVPTIEQLKRKCTLLVYIEAINLFKAFLNILSYPHDFLYSSIVSIYLCTPLELRTYIEYHPRG